MVRHVTGCEEKYKNRVQSHKSAIASNSFLLGLFG